MITLYQLHWSHYVEKRRSNPHDSAGIPSLPAARNDQQSVGRWPALFGPFWYLRLLLTCGLARAAYP